MLRKERHLCEGRVSSGEMSEPWGPGLQQSILASWKVEGLEWTQVEHRVVSKSCTGGRVLGDATLSGCPGHPQQRGMTTPCTRSWAEDSPGAGQGQELGLMIFVDPFKLQDIL